MDVGSTSMNIAANIQSMRTNTAANVECGDGIGAFCPPARATELRVPQHHRGAGRPPSQLLGGWVGEGDLAYGHSRTVTGRSLAHERE